MPRNQDERRLFDPGHDLVSDQQIAADAAAAVDGQPQPDLDSARMWVSRHDGLLVRGVKPHSAQKSKMVSRGIDTVSSAMSKQWFTEEHGLQYVELYSGPGRLLDEVTAQEIPGSPLEALSVREPFTKYVFNDYSSECVDALAARTADRTDVHVLCGSANDPEHLKTIADLLDEKALIVAYLDPARPQDLHWSTIEFLAQRFKYLDLIINLPVNSTVRAIVGAHSAGHAGEGAAGRLINHPRPNDLLQRSRSGKLVMNGSMDAVREHFDQQLMGLGFKRPARRTVDFPPGNPYYDMLLVSRHDRGVELWNKTNPPQIDARLSLLDLLGDEPPA
jgi:three-Cys-motif partner protein